MDLHGIYRLVEQVVTAWNTVRNLNWMVPPLPTCRRSLKRISVNFALRCLSDIMIKILKESQFTVESVSLGERLLSLTIRTSATAITRGWHSIFTLHSNLFGDYREAQLESKTAKDTHLLQISPQNDTTWQLDFMGNHLLTLLIKLPLYKPGLIK